MKPSLEVQPVQPLLFWNEGPAPLLQPVQGMSEREQLRLAMVIPPFSRGSGGHNTLFQIFTRLERRGHACSVWLADYHNQMRDVRAARMRREVREYFAPFEGPVYKGFDQWQGADVAIATGWQTVHATLALDGCRARAYVVNDHEPEFYSSSTEQLLAADTYRHGLHCIAASPWLRDLLIERYDASADAFQLGVDGDTYRPLPVERRRDTVIYYARHSTPRRAVPIGLMALAELHRRRPAADGQRQPVHVHVAIAAGGRIDERVRLVARDDVGAIQGELEGHPQHLGGAGLFDPGGRRREVVRWNHEQAGRAATAAACRLVRDVESTAAGARAA